MTAEEVGAFVRRVYPQSSEFGWQALAVRPGEIDVRLTASGNDLRPGGTLSGPTMFTLADVAAYLLVLAHVGEVELAVTTSAVIHFLSKPPLGDLIAQGKLIKLGKRLAVCEVHITSAASEALVAQATVTYSIPSNNA
jgi:uncharacterized protein (TIGR00369 family)